MQRRCRCVALSCKSTWFAKSLTQPKQSAQEQAATSLNSLPQSVRRLQRSSCGRHRYLGGETPSLDAMGIEPKMLALQNL
jgi:hypothetical protein